MTEDFEREERAFRRALATRADSYQPVDRAVPTRPVRRPPWHVIGGVAAALALLGGLITLVATARTDEVSSSSSAGGAAGSAAAARLPDPAAGMRWVSRYDVAVQVPSSWPYAVPPGRPDCIHSRAGYDGPDSPYVAVDTELAGGTAQGCVPPPTDAPKAFGRLLFQLWQPYLAFARAGDPGAGADGTWTYRGWTLTRWTLNDVQLSLLTGPGQQHLARQIRASARLFSVDENGCPASSPVQAKSFVRPPRAGGWVAFSVSVCQYERGTTRPGLIGSELLGGARMEALLHAITKAPRGGGPDSPGDCGHAFLPGSTAIEIIVGSDGSGPHFYMYYDSCTGNGVFTGGSSSELTHELCAAVFVEPQVAITTAFGAVADRCMR